MKIDYQIELREGNRLLVIGDDEEPMGLREIEFTIIRHPQWHGVFPEISTGLKFHGYAYDFIKDAYYRLGVEAVIRCIIRMTDGDVYEDVYDGLIDLTTATMTHEYIEVDIVPNNCLNTFLDRLDKNVNLYDEPCFNELTEDKSAFRTRYRYAPYSLEVPEVEMTGLSSFVLADDDVLTSSFIFNGGFGCTLFLCDGGSIPCGYSSYCDNNTPPDFSSANLTYVYLNQNFPISIVKDDLELLNQPYIANIAIQHAYDCGFNDVLDTIPLSPYWEVQKWTSDLNPIGKANACKCHYYEIDYQLKGEYDIVVLIGGGLHIEYLRITPEIVLTWGAYEHVAYSGVPHLFDNGCVPYSVSDFDPITFELNLGTFSFDEAVSLIIDSCNTQLLNEKVQTNDELNIMLRFKVGGIFENSILQSGGFQVDIRTRFEVAEGTIRSSCSKMPPIGNTTVNAYMIHEAFSRIVEHHTNNCMRVKSEYFGRPDSLEWGDDADTQCPSVCGYSGGYPVYLPNTGNPCNTFDLTDYQTAEIGCGAATTITNGLALRQRGTEMFVTFNELYHSTNAVFAIGMGWTQADPNNIRIENWEYFYGNNVILTIDNLDPYNSKLNTKVAYEWYFNRINFGFKQWLKDVFSTEDVIHTTREYSIPLKNVKDGLDRLSDFIGDCYAIEWQRRSSILTDNGEFDDEKFFICVGKSPDENNEMFVFSSPSGGRMVPDHYFIAEQGINFNVNAKEDILNYRITPKYILDRWAKFISVCGWTKTGSDNFTFAKGEVNFKAGGTDLPNHTLCVNAQAFEDSDYLIQPVNIFPEIVEFEYPITPFEFKVIRNNPYGCIFVNGNRHHIMEVTFRPNQNSRFKLLKHNNI